MEVPVASFIVFVSPISVARKNEAVGDAFRFLSQMLADEYVVETKFVGANDCIALFLQGLRQGVGRGMQRHHYIPSRIQALLACFI